MMRLLAAALVVLSLSGPLTPTRAADYSNYECPEYAKLLDQPGAGFVLVSAQWCPACHRLEKQLQEQGIDYVVVDVDRHPKNATLFYHAQIPQLYVVTRAKKLVHVTLQFVTP